MSENEKILRLKQVMERTGLSRSTIYVLIEANDFPSQYKLGARTVGWFESDINGWLQSRKRARENNV